jgi:hypothetical protein
MKQLRKEALMESKKKVKGRMLKAEKNVSGK